MAKQILMSVLIVLVTLSFARPIWAQQPAAAAAPAAGEEKGKVGGPRKQLATIIFAGLGGAILGLSTLSFYGRPQDKLANIAIGFAVGAIVGTGVVTFRAASDPAEFYGTQSQYELDHWQSHQLPSHQQYNVAQRVAPEPLTPSFKLAWDF